MHVQLTRSVVDIPARYVDAGHVGHAYAMTVNKAHGLTCDATMMLGDDLIYRELAYEAMSGGRKENRIYMSRGTMTELDLQLEDGPHARTVESRHAIELLAAGLERRRNKHLALDSIASVPLEAWSTSDLLTERARVRVILDQAPADRSADLAALIESRRDVGTRLREAKLSVAKLKCATVYRELVTRIRPSRYHLDHEMTGWVDDGDSVEVHLAGRPPRRVDLLVCADGVGSMARARLLPAVRPSYSGYVAWRGMVPEARLDAATRAVLDDAITYYVYANSHILVYPIPGPDGCVAPGHRLMNFVWYRNYLEGSDLDDVLTDDDGHASRDLGAAGLGQRAARRRDARRRPCSASHASGARRVLHCPAVPAGDLRHRGAAHGVWPSLPDWRRRVRGPTARGGGNGEGGGRRLGAGRRSRA